MTSATGTFSAVIGVLVLAAFTNTAAAGCVVGRPAHGSVRLSGISVSVGGDGWLVSYRLGAPQPCQRGWAAGRAGGWRAGSGRAYHRGKHKPVLRRGWQRARHQRWQRRRSGRRSR